MNPHRQVLLLLACAFAGPATAQSFGYMVELSSRTDEHSTGLRRDSLGVGFGLSAVAGGYAEKDWAFLLPVSGELRWAFNGNLELNADADAMFRFGPFSAGAGIDLRWLFGGKIDSGPSAGTSLLDPIAAGYSISGKLRLWPDRLFVQGRFSWLPAHLDERGPHLVCAYEFCVTSDPVDYIGGTEMKLAAGWIFSGGWGGKSWVLRAQWVQRALSFVRAGDNANGIYDRTSTMISIAAIQYM
jgi:hypothetical protein